MRAAKQAVPRHARFGATYVLRAPDGQTGPRVNPAAVRLSELPPPPKGSKKPHVSHSASPRFVLPELFCESGRCMSSLYCPVPQQLRRPDPVDMTNSFHIIYALQAADAGATMAPLPQRLLATMAGYAEQFLGASYDVLLGNVRKVLMSFVFLQCGLSLVVRLVERSSF